jgi:hypothetical protein
MSKKSNNNARTLSKRQTAELEAWLRQPKSKKPKANNPSNRNQPRPKAAPIARTRAFAKSEPRIRQTSVKSCRIQHREFVDLIYFQANTGDAFLPIQYPLNPGMDQTFSWLSNIAINWERYKFHKLTFHFLTRVPSTTTGSVLMAPDYDPADAAPIDELTMMSYQDAREDVAWKDQIIHCNMKSLSGGN